MVQITSINNENLAILLHTYTKAFINTFVCFVFDSFVMPGRLRSWMSMNTS